MNDQPNNGERIVALETKVVAIEQNVEKLSGAIDIGNADIRATRALVEKLIIERNAGWKVLTVLGAFAVTLGAWLGKYLHLNFGSPPP